MKFHFSIKASFTVNTKGWYCVTKGNISFSSLLFCFGSTDFGFCEFHLFLIAIFLSNCVGSLCPSSTIKRSFEFWNTFLKLFWQIGGWQAAKCVLEGFRSLYIKDNFFVESRAFVYNCLLKPALSQWISVVNLIVGWCKFASSKKVTISG